MRHTKLIAVILFIFLLSIFFITGCVDKEENIMQEQYMNCTSVCAEITDDFTTMYYCNEECKKKFWEEE